MALECLAECLQERKLELMREPATRAVQREISEIVEHLAQIDARLAKAKVAA